MDLVRRLTVVVIALLASACASTGAVPKPFPLPGPAPLPSAPGTDPASAAPSAAVPRPLAFDGYALVGTALALRGVPYRNGGSDPSGFDCSGFTQYVFAQYGIALPREVREQFRTGKPVQPRDVIPGDLLFFSTTAPGASHVGIAIGSDEFVHAPSSTGVVRVERLGSTYWAPRFIGAKRLG
jgi:cell wall-associated NlpC family hydrolase